MSSLFGRPQSVSLAWVLHMIAMFDLVVMRLGAECTGDAVGDAL